MTFTCLTQLYAMGGLLCDGDGDGMPDGFAARFSVGSNPGAIDVAARLGLESAGWSPGFTQPEAPGVPVYFGPDNREAPALPFSIPTGSGVVALVRGAVVVTGHTLAAAWDAARWLAATFPLSASGGQTLASMAGGRPVVAAIIKEGAVLCVMVGEGLMPRFPDKLLRVGPPEPPPFPAEPLGDLPPIGLCRLFTVASLLGSSDGIQPDRAGWQVQITPRTSSAEIAALCELAARTGVESTGLRFPFAVEGAPAEPAVLFAREIPPGCEWVEDGIAWRKGALTIVSLSEMKRTFTLHHAAANAGLVDGIHTTQFTSRAGLPQAVRPEGSVVFDIGLDQEWEVERFRRVWRERVLPALKPARATEVDLRLSEPLTVREALAGEIADSLTAACVNWTAIRVLPAYKQGFHWLEEEVLPVLTGLRPLGRVTVSCARFATAGLPVGSDAGDPLELPIRWLQELYPADELLSAALGVPVAFDLTPDRQEHIYVLTAYRPDGTVAYSEGFSPVCGARPYLPEFPLRGRVHPPTGMLRVTQAGSIVEETAIDTDAEAFWSAYQEHVFPRLRQYITSAHGPAPDPAAQPFFGKLVVEVALSEDDRRLGIREEQISPLDALHEDLYFGTLDYLNELGMSLTGKGFSAPGAVEPWVTGATGGGVKARIRLYACPPTEPEAKYIPPPAKAAPDLPTPAAGLTNTEVIGPDQLPPYLAYLSTLPGVRVWRAGLSFGGRATWALSVIPPTAGSIAPPHKLSAWRPTLLVNARRHANEVSSTNSILKLAELMARRKPNLNLIISPMENVDGAAVHYAMQQIHPTWKLHAARFNTAGVDFGADGFAPKPRFGESRTLPTLWRAFLPDVVLDDHGYPSHEWVQPFSGYSSPPYFRTSWWMPNALIYGIFRWADAERFPANGAAQRVLRDALARRLTADPEIAGYTATLLDRYVTYGRKHVPEKFPLEMHNGFVCLTGQVTAGPDARTFVGRFPHITAAELVTEVPDETAQGDYLALCARAHLEGDLAVAEALSGKAQPLVRRRWEQNGQVFWTVGRPRPISL